jgi:hypothetical protein
LGTSLGKGRNFSLFQREYPEMKCKGEGIEKIDYTFH